MRFITTFVTAIFLFVVSSEAIAQTAPDCSTQAGQLADYFAAHPTKVPEEGSRLLAFDHKTQRWGGYKAERVNGVMTAVTDTADFDGLKLGNAVVALPKHSDRIHVYVTNTNPLLYSVKQTGAEQKARDEIATLKDVFSATGNLIAAAVAAAGERHKTADLNAHVQATASTFEFRVMNRNPVRDFSDALSQIVDKVIEQEVSVEGAARSVDATVRSTALVTTKIISAAQQAEIGVTPKLDITGVTASTPADVDAAFDGLAAAYNQLATSSPTCIDVVAAAKRMIDTKLAGFGKDAAGLAAQDAFHADFELIRAGRGCSESIVPAQALADWLKANMPQEGPLAPALRPALIDLSALAQKYNDVLTRRDKMLTDAATALAARTTAVTAAARYQLAKELVDDAAVRNHPCALIAGVLELDRTNDAAADLAITDIATEKFKIDTRADAANLTLTREAPLEEPYTITRRLGHLFDVDVALVYTKLTDPSYDLEAVPAATSSRRASPLDDTSKKRIILKSESSRAGDLAALVTFNTWWKTIHPQFGAALSTDHPGIFAGVGYAPVKYIKLSSGWTIQQVTKLPSGQQVGTEVPGTTTAVQTRKGFSGKWYAALSVTLNGLSFFNK